ncbi:unnamed protein product [Didymodactylos carnosus]|uniref:Protein transport protein Sec24C n=1 Tax=Didymodactylos carnosus TaxID=1234261 RepID=A0A813ZDY3_9BILA|nr:unnamed protein product [Didymodactylos carnosus]CAF0897654.1 unnamed protein product [Didymodactylos carnosus]CAF3515080.1 unnamed protein product [Didymodactylos carnosus]CAF3680649.1 unnamed protein product [Didymodactylos carnosus]
MIEQMRGGTQQYSGPPLPQHSQPFQSQQNHVPSLPPYIQNGPSLMTPQMQQQQLRTMDMSSLSSALPPSQNIRAAAPMPNQFGPPPNLVPEAFQQQQQQSPSPIPPQYQQQSTFQGQANPSVSNQNRVSPQIPSHFPPQPPSNLSGPPSAAFPPYKQPFQVSQIPTFQNQQTPQSLSGPVGYSQQPPLMPPITNQPNLSGLNSYPNQPSSMPPFSNQQSNLSGPTYSQQQRSQAYPPGMQPISSQSNLSGPPVPGIQQQNGSTGYPGQPSAGPQFQQSQQQRIDPDMIPNVVQVLEQMQEKTQEPFITNTLGVLPPLVATNFICQDQGSCNPRFIRATTYSVPNAADMIKQSHIPVALAISPLASLRSEELEPPITNFGDIGPVRCHRCKAYMCSFMQFIDGGKRFICAFCNQCTDVGTEYFNHLDHNGRRLDWYQRPELCLGSYEILATKQYCKDEKWPEAPAFIFMIDVSYSSVRSGLLHFICQILKDELLNYLPKDKNAETSTVRVGFATFDKQLHFYNIKNTLGQPQMMIVSDLEEVFMPLLDGFLALPDESRNVINSLLDQIPQTFAHTQETETILGPVIQAGIEALKGAGRVGKLYIFSTTLPIAVAPGKLANRDDKKLLGTDKEKIILAPVNNFYTKLGEECAQNGCAVDLFVFPNNYLDLATIGEVCRISGGQMYKFNYFSVENDGERLLNELKRNFQRTTVFDALMRVRTSTGIRPIDFLGNFYMTNATEMTFGSIDSDKSVCVELKHDDKLPTETNTFIQVALLYTSISGQRRLRILTLGLTVTAAYTSLYPGCDLDAVMNYTAKVVNQAANMLACYRKNCAQSTTAGQLILPETLKLLPIYVTALIKCDALIGTQTVTTDDRSWLIHKIMAMDVKSTFAYLYPRIFALHNIEEDTIPPMIRCSYERFSETGAYVLENGLVMYIWLGSQINPTVIQCLFGVPSLSQVEAEKCKILDLDNQISKNVRNLLNYIRNDRNSHLKLFIVHQRDSIEPFFKNYLIEDKGFTGGASYVDFLYHLHREIRNILQ